MSNPYQLKDDLGMFPFINYRYEGKEITFYSLKGVEPDEGSRFLATEHEVIMDWATVSNEALTSKEFKESDTPCWEGHYEQFGRVMLNLANMCRDRKTLDGKWNPYFDSVLPKSNLHKFILSGYGGTEDRVFYRAWFSLLGHPDFLSQSLIEMESTNFKTTELQLLLSFNDLNRHLFTKNKP